MMNVLGCLERPDAGSVEIDGREADGTEFADVLVDGTLLGGR